MGRKTVPTVLFFMLSLSMFTFALTSTIPKVRSDPTTWTVDDDGPPANFTTIQEALDSPLVVDGDTIIVYSGVYHENVTIEKSISLIGRDPLTTILDGDGDSPFIIRIFNTMNVALINFTVQNSTSYPVSYGISLSSVVNVIVQNIVVRKCWHGLSVVNSTNCRIVDSRFTENYAIGIDLREQSTSNSFIGNTIMNNPVGVFCGVFSSENNFFYRNNFLNNTKQQDTTYAGLTFWDNGVEGNFWDDYAGVDIDGDGIGDTNPPYDSVRDHPYQDVDVYPLIEPWNQTRTYTVVTTDTYQVVVNCNYTVASFAFNDTLSLISFYITGPAGWRGFCNVTIPNGLLTPNPPSEKWIVTMDPNQVTCLSESIDDSTLLFLNYTLGSSMLENRVRIGVGELYWPTASFQFAPDPASVIEPVNFTDTSNSPNGPIIWRQWSFGDGNVTVTNETLVIHEFENKAWFDVTLTVRDNESLSDSLTRPVWVRNLPPAADFSFSPANPSVGSEVNFDASESRDPDGGIVEYRWNFGDIAAANTTSATTTHMFRHVGAYNVTLTAIDDDGGEDRVAQVIPVGKGATHLDIDAPTGMKVEKQMLINATLLDNGGEPVAYKQITIEVYNDDFDFSRNVTTNAMGIATTTLSVNTSGEYIAKASYLGSSDYLASESSVSLTVNPLPTRLELQSPESTTQNKEVTMSATLLDEDENPIYNATVEFRLYDGNTSELLGASQTDQGGVASFNHTLAHAGTFFLKATYNGDGKYAASTSDENSLAVAAPETDYIPYIIVAAIIIAAVTLSLIFFRRRKGKSS